MFSQTFAMIEFKRKDPAGSYCTSYIIYPFSLLFGYHIESCHIFFLRHIYGVGILLGPGLCGKHCRSQRYMILRQSRKSILWPAAVRMATHIYQQYFVVIKLKLIYLSLYFLPGVYFLNEQYILRN